MTAMLAIGYRYFYTDDLKLYRVVPTVSGAMNPANWDDSGMGRGYLRGRQ